MFSAKFPTKQSECGLPNDHFGRLTSVTLVLIIKNKLGSAQVPKFGRLLVKKPKVW